MIPTRTHRSNMSIRHLVLLFAPIFISFSAVIRGTQAWQCENSCGGIPLSAPFGSGPSCGSPAFEPYVNCTHNRLYFHTPTGRYPIQTIDYINNVMIVSDPHMSTCNSMGSSSSFGLPVGAPFSFAPFDTVALIGCSSVSSLYAKQSCDPSALSQDICKSLYNACPGLSYLEGINANNPSTSCCVYSSSSLNAAPYEIDLSLLQCQTYTSVYRISSIHDPINSWLYGIALQYNPGSSQSGGSGGGDHPSCYICEEALGSSSANKNIMVTPMGLLWNAGVMVLLVGASLIMFT